MTENGHLKNIISAERQDQLEILLRLENALSRDDLDADLRSTYIADIPYRRRCVKYLEFLLDCCNHWPTTLPDVSCADMAREMDDGLEWPECMLADNPSAFAEYICLCSRTWRIEHHDIS
jgi:hypothetical protein